MPGTYEPLPTGATPSEELIRSWLTTRLAEQIRVAPAQIDPNDTFDDHGIGSTEAVMLAGDIERWLDRELSATLLWDYPTITTLASFLAAAVRL